MLRFKASSHLYISSLVKNKDLYLCLLESLSSSCFLLFSCLSETSSPAALTVPVLVHSIPSARCLVYYIHLLSRDQARAVKPHFTLKSSKRLSGSYKTQSGMSLSFSNLKPLSHFLTGCHTVHSACRCQ